MNKKIIYLTIASTLLFSVGCSSSNTKETTNIENTQTSTTESKYTHEQKYKTYEELLPQVKELFNKYGFNNIRDYGMIDNEYYKGTSGIMYHESEDVQVGDIYSTKYLMIDENDKTQYIHSKSFLNVNPYEIVSNGFDIQGTFFDEITKIMCKEDVDYEEINADITNAYKNSEILSTLYEYEDVEIYVVADGKALSYTINIYK